MQRIATATKATDLFGAGKNGFKDGNLGTGVPPTDLEAAWFNGVQEELVNIIEAAGLVASGATLNQVVQAIAIMARQQTNTAFTTTGAAPNFALAPTLPITAYAQNMRFRVKFNVAGTGADVINVSTLGNKSLKQYDTSGAKVAAVIVVNQLADIEYDGVDFVILDPLPTTGLQAGEITFFARNTAPSGYLKANGAAISRATYATLFAAIGTTFGVGDGGTTFNVPDLRGEFLRGWDDARGADSGRAFGTAQSDLLKTHTHSITSNSNNGNAGTTSVYSSAGSASYTNTTDIQSTGGTETRPRNVAMLACIKY